MGFNPVRFAVSGYIGPGSKSRLPTQSPEALNHIAPEPKTGIRAMFVARSLSDAMSAGEVCSAVTAMEARLVISHLKP